MRWHLTLLLALPLIACDDDGGESTPAVDASVAADAQARADSTPTPDGATPTPDAAPPAQDGAPPAQDGAPPAQDGAPPTQDAFVIPDGAVVFPDGGPVNDAGECLPECPVGQTRCEGAAGVVTCEDIGGGCGRWSDAVACPQGEACAEGACAAACQAEDTRCLDALTLQVCEAGQLTQTTCPFGCEGGLAACRPCPEGAWRCLDRGDETFSLEYCNAGAEWSLVNVCDECMCVAGDPVHMRCQFVQDDQPTECNRCSEDGLFCFQEETP